MKHCMEMWSRTQWLLLALKCIELLRLHKADAFSINRFEIILCSDCTVEPLGGGKQKNHEFCMRYLVKCDVSSKMNYIYDQKNALDVDLGLVYNVATVWSHSSKYMRLHIF